MAERGRPLGAKAKPSMTAVPDSMKPYLKVTALLSLRQLAEVMGISYRSILNLHSKHPENLPPSIRIGGVIRFRADEVDEWIWSIPVNKGA